MTQTVTIKPARLNIALYGDGNAWSVEMRPTVNGQPLGDLTADGVAIVAKHRADGADTSTDLTVAVTDATTFAIGHSTPLAGRYDVQITFPGSLPRTYIYGTITVQAEAA